MHSIQVAHISVRDELHAESLVDIVTANQVRHNRCTEKWLERGKDTVQGLNARFACMPDALQHRRDRGREANKYLPGLISSSFSLESSGGCKRLFLRQQRAGYVYS